MKKTNLLIAIILIVTTLPLISAYGAGCPYWKDRPLIMSPGETKEITCMLQNMVGEKDITLQAEITSGKEIAEITDKNYFLPFGKKDIKANLKITIPENIEKNQEQVTISFKQISTNEGKMIQIASAVTASFPVIIEDVKKAPLTSIKPSSSKWIFYLIISVIIISIITITSLIIILIRKNKETFLNKAPLPII